VYGTLGANRAAGQTEYHCRLNLAVPVVLDPATLQPVDILADYSNARAAD